MCIRDSSYGLQVAQLAGVPHEVIAQARHYLETLEAERDTRNVMRASLQRELPLIPPAPLDPRAEELRREVEALDPDALAPREAHAALYLSLIHIFGKVGWQNDKTDVDLSYTYADTNLYGDGATPLSMLAYRRAATYTPDFTQNLLNLSLIHI